MSGIRFGALWPVYGPTEQVDRLVDQVRKRNDAKQPSIPTESFTLMGPRVLPDTGEIVDPDELRLVLTEERDVAEFMDKLPALLDYQSDLKEKYSPLELLGLLLADRETQIARLLPNEQEMTLLEYGKKLFQAFTARASSNLDPKIRADYLLANFERLDTVTGKLT